MRPEDLVDQLNTFQKESTALKEQITELCYYMNGGLEFNTAWGMSFEDREIMIKVINKRLKEQNPKAKEYM